MIYTVLYVNSLSAKKSVKPLLKYNSNITHAKYMIQRTLVYSELYNRHPQLLECFHYPEKKSHVHLQLLSMLSTPWETHLFLPILDTSYKWNPIICDLL